jgi:hypothetical protein
VKTRIGALLILAGLTSCRHVDWNYVGGDLVIAECRRTADCYWAAAQACPYGYEPLDSSSRTTGVTASRVGGTTIVNVVREGELLVRCSQPTFCESQPCAYGSRCVQSQKYPGRRVCSIQ